MYMLNKCPRIVDVTNAYFWYCRLGHINKNRMSRLTQEGIFDKDDYKLLPTCKSCLLEKMTKSPFNGKGEWASDVLGLVHTNVCGPISTSARREYHYFITFIDDLLRYWYVYLMKHKSESFKIFKRFCNEIEKQTEKDIKTFDQIEEQNIFLVNFWHILKIMRFFLNGYLLEHHNIMVY